MTKFKVYIVTHNHEEALARCLRSISNGDIRLHSHEINVINNYQTLRWPLDSYDLEINVLDNVLRPAHSTGHLGRNWNQAIVNGFADLKNPQCEFVVCLQGDTEVVSECFSMLDHYHAQDCHFIQDGRGDQLMSWSPKGIIEIGLFDERICGIGFQEQEYFERATRLFSQGISINDRGHGRFHNALPHRLVTDYGDSTCTGIFHPFYQSVTQNILARAPKYFMYPYFEKDISVNAMKEYVGWQKLAKHTDQRIFKEG